MNITKLVKMKKITLDENATGEKEMYTKGDIKRVRINISDMEYKILFGLKQLKNLEEANTLVQNNWICYYYSNRNIILIPFKNQKITISYDLDYDPYNMHIIDERGNVAKAKMQREFREIMIKIMKNLGKRFGIKEVS